MLSRHMDGVTLCVTTDETRAIDAEVPVLPCVSSGPYEIPVGKPVRLALSSLVIMS